MIEAVKWMLIAMAVIIVLAACNQGGSSSGIGSSKGATTTQVEHAMYRDRSKALQGIQLGIMAIGSITYNKWFHGSEKELREGLIRMREGLSGITVGAACIKGFTDDDGKDNGYGWARGNSIYFCELPLDRLKDTRGWWYHEGSHVLMGTKDYAYGKVESQALPSSKAVRNAASIAGYLGEVQ